MNTNVCDFGAVGDGVSVSTLAFNQAVSACSASGGGVVDVPSGTYLCGTVRLLDNVILNLLPGSRIIGSLDINDYTGTQRGCSWGGASSALGIGLDNNPCAALIVADRCVNCGITGFGTIDGQRSRKHGYSEEKGRPFLVVFSECRFVTVRDVTLANPGMFTLYALACEDVNIDGVKIRSADSWNGDGLDFDGGKRVTISNCNIDAGDDGIGLKTLDPSCPCEDFSITNCYISTHTYGAVRIGPESAGDMKRINVSNCCFNNSNDGFKLQLTQDAVFEDFCFSNITMTDVLRPFFLTSNRYNMSSLVKDIRPRSGVFRRMKFANMTAVLRPTTRYPGSEDYPFYAGNYISALPGDVIEDVTLENIHFVAPGGGRREDAERVSGHGDMYDFWQCYPEQLINVGEFPSAVLYLRNAKDIRLLNCTFECETEDQRAAIAAECVDGLLISDAQVRRCGALVRHYRCEGLRVRDSEGELLPFSAAQASEWEAFRRASLQVDKTLEEMSAAVQRVLALETQASFDTLSFELIRDEDTAQYLFIPKFTGNFELYVNGEKAAEWCMPSCYITPYPFALALAPLLVPGANRIELRPQGTFELTDGILVKHA